MRTNKILIILLSMLLVLSVGCSSGNKHGKDIIVIEKQGTTDYEFYHEVKSSKKVQEAKEILDGIKWINACVSMDHPPDYKFHFENSRTKILGEAYDLWISPNKDQIDLVMVDRSKYFHLNMKDSAKLFQIITGKKLSEG